MVSVDINLNSQDNGLMLNRGVVMKNVETATAALVELLLTRTCQLKKLSSVGLTPLQDKLTVRCWVKFGSMLWKHCQNLTNSRGSYEIQAIQNCYY